MLNSTRIEGKEGFLRPCVMESNEAGKSFTCQIHELPRHGCNTAKRYHDSIGAGGAAGIKVAAEAAPHQDAAELVEAMQGERSPQRRENYGRRP